MAIFGLDFGTTNSVATIIGRPVPAGAEQPLVLTSREDSRPHPSVVWYSGADTVVGRKAKSQLRDLGLGVFGDIVRSPKIYLGSPIPINVSGVNRATVDVVADILRFLRQDALARGYPEQTFEHAVFTIPVTMMGRARRELRQAALKAGLHVHQFVHEPLAALYGHLRGKPDFHQRLAQLQDRLALVFDWGGGTLDLTLCKFSNGMLIQILNLGDADVGGDQFDLRLVKLVKDRHQQQHPGLDWSLLTENAEPRLIQACEDAKIDLSTHQEHDIFVKDILASTGPERDLRVRITRQDLDQATLDLVRRGLGCIKRLLDAAGIPASAVEFCLATGGMAAVPAIRQGLLEIFGMARLHDPNNAATVISEGAAWIAHDGLRLRMAKSLDLLHAGDDHVAFVHAGTELPVEGKQIRNALSMYCVDPRDGIAKFQFSRSKWPGRDAAADERLTYTTLTVEVDEHADPLHERLEVEVRIDHDLIACVSAHSSLRGDLREAEIHDLEFGLGLRPSDSGSQNAPPAAGQHAQSNAASPQLSKSAHSQGSVRIRSNVATTSYAWELVPGEIVRKYRTGHELTSKQRKESTYYIPCYRCGRNIHVINRDGCDSCNHANSTREAAARRAASRVTVFAHSHT
jgi:molecular chaperone DnaK